MRLAVLDIACSNEAYGGGQSCCAQAYLSQHSRTRGHDGPTISGQRREQADSPGQRDHTFEVLNLAAFYLAVFLFVIRVRKQLPNGG